MIKYITGNILDSKAEALVNTVNTAGVMGKGITHRPICDANAVQPCQQPKTDDCPRGGKKK